MTSFTFNTEDNFHPLSPSQLELYLNRIGVDPAIALGKEPSLTIMNLLIHHHIRVIPFENLELLFLQKPGPITVEGVFDQVVLAKRGGYCYQNNIIMTSALRSLGFKTSTGVGRPILQDVDLKSYTVRPPMHMLIFVEIPGMESNVIDTYVIDVGRHRFSQAMKVADGSTIQNAGNDQFLLREGLFNTHSLNYTLMLKRAPLALLAEGVDTVGEEFRPQHLFTLERYRPADFQVFNHFVTTGKKHAMQSMLFLAIVTKTGGRAEMLGNVFRRRESGDYRDICRREEVTTLDQFVRILDEEFGLILSDEEKDGALSVMLGS